MYIIYENNMSPQTPDSLACFDHFVDARKDTLEQWVFLLFLTKKKTYFKGCKSWYCSSDDGTIHASFKKTRTQSDAQVIHLVNHVEFKKTQ